jgi:RNA-directed DNA polymerase
MKEIGYRKNTISHAAAGESRTGTGASVEQQIPLTLNAPEDLTRTLMERISSNANLNQAYKRVRANRGSAGIDKMTVKDLRPWIGEHKEQLIQSLLQGTYQPAPVREVKIPKAGKRGETRQLGIPTVVDRLVQQAIHQVLEPIFDPKFSDSSYGFRPGRGAHHAIIQASEYVCEGREWVVDIDLEKFFDRVNHDILMSKLAKRIEDKRLLKIIRKFLQAGIMRNGVSRERHEGTPQGGPLSPLLSNILLDELDKELERRGHRFCRYADDQNIYVRSKRSGERVYQSVKQFLEKRLKLKVNEKKSAVSPVNGRKFLGYQIGLDGHLAMAPETKRRAKEKIRQLTRRSRGRSMGDVIREMNTFLRGWLNYYRLCTSRNLWRELDSWIRRRLRCYKLKQRKRGRGIKRLLLSLGIDEKSSHMTGYSSKGLWRTSTNRAVHRALNKAWFKDQGLMGLEERWALLKV